MSMEESTTPDYNYIPLPLALNDKLVLPSDESRLRRVRINQKLKNVGQGDTT